MKEIQEDYLFFTYSDFMYNYQGKRAGKGIASGVLAK
jgi:hypothetical protein